MVVKKAGWGWVFGVILGCHLAAWAAPEVPLFPLIPPVYKPSGAEFKFWSNTTVWRKTWHVDNRAPGASDTNPGSKEAPFKTIGKAAEVLMPGECVVVHTGIYRECVRPLRGGTGPEAMIGYLAEDGVVVKGSDPAGRNWSPEGDIWVFDLAKLPAGGDGPFLKDNVPDGAFDLMDWAKGLRGKLPYTLPRGLVFQDGNLLIRVAARMSVATTEGSYYTDRAARKVYVRTRKGTDPNACAMELTTREAGFRPAARGLGFIQVRGFVFEQVGNGFPRPQEGAVTVGAGHHWLIENNAVRFVNGVGIDIGDGWYGGAIHPPEEGPDTNVGWNIVRNNRVSHTGVCGIAGIPAPNALIEGNDLFRCTLYPVAPLFECAGIKTHRNFGTLIRRNRVAESLDHGIWLDYDNRDSRCTENNVLGARFAIHIEASVREACLLDGNRVFDADVGFMENDSRGQIFSNNVLGYVGTAFDLWGKNSERRVAGLPTGGGGMMLLDNAVYRAWEILTEHNREGAPNLNLRTAHLATPPMEIKNQVGIASEHSPIQILRNPTFADGTNGWMLGCYFGGRAEFSQETEGGVSSARIAVQDGGKAAWHVQWVQPIRVEAGHTYELRAALRGEYEGMKITVGFIQDHEPRRSHLRNITLGKSETRLPPGELVFRALGPDTMNLVFFLGGEGPGSVWVRDVSVLQGSPTAP